MKTIGYIGTGIMGSAMALNLMKAGFKVVVCNRTPANAEPVLKLGAEWADHPSDLAKRVQAVCINVTDTADVEQVIFGPHGIVEGNPGNTADFVIIDHSTISPQLTRDMAGRLAVQGISFLDAPVTGGDVGARNATLSVMVGGPAHVYERCLPIFQAVGKNIAHMGDHGAGQACKAVNQVLVALNLIGVAEAFALAQKEGLDLKRVIAVTQGGGGGSWQLSNLGPRIASGDMKPGFMINLINKDLNIVYQEAHQLGVPMPGLRLAAELLRSAALLGHGRDGTQSVIHAYRALGATIGQQS
jgi:3-hydroxyisobutyrate dehydrogenase-like beta-hydroxyacid dehydrogenase